MPGGITYNATSLQTDNIITSEIEHHSTPKKKISMASIAYGNRSIITNSNTTEKEINISGTLDPQSSIADMDELEDTFKGILIGEDMNLDIEHGTGTRRYIATPEYVQVRRPGGLNWGTFDVRFICSQPFGIDLVATELASISGHTSATLVIPIDIVGNSEYQYPVTEVTLVGGTQLSNGTISIGNNLNGQVVSITRNWIASDVLVIDHFNNLVTVNNIEVPFTGAIPVFGTGAQGLTYSDTFLTRDVDFHIEQFGLWQ